MQMAGRGGGAAQGSGGKSESNDAPALKHERTSGSQQTRQLIEMRARPDGLAGRGSHWMCRAECERGARRGAGCGIVQPVAEIENAFALLLPCLYEGAF